MSPEIKLTISQNDNLIATVTKKTEKQDLVQCLEEFQLEANAALTKMIKELGDLSEISGDCTMDYEDEDDDDDKDKRTTSHDKEQKGLNKRKKKKF